MSHNRQKVAACRAGMLAMSLLLIAADGPPSTPGATPATQTRSWFWCGVQGATTTSYVTDVQSRLGVTKFRIRSLEFQFLQTVNATYGEHLEGGRGLCRSFASVIRAQSALSDFRNQLQRGGQAVVVIGTY